MQSSIEQQNYHKLSSNEADDSKPNRRPSNSGQSEALDSHKTNSHRFESFEEAMNDTILTSRNLLPSQYQDLLPEEGIYQLARDFSDNWALKYKKNEFGVVTRRKTDLNENISFLDCTPNHSFSIVVTESHKLYFLSLNDENEPNEKAQTPANILTLAGRVADIKVTDDMKWVIIGYSDSTGHVQIYELNTEPLSLKLHREFRLNSALTKISMLQPQNNLILGFQLAQKTQLFYLNDLLTQDPNQKLLLSLIHVPTTLDSIVLKSKAELPFLVSQGAGHVLMPPAHAPSGSSAVIPIDLSKSLIFDYISKHTRPYHINISQPFKFFLSDNELSQKPQNQRKAVFCIDFDNVEVFSVDKEKKCLAVVYKLSGEKMMQVFAFEDTGIRRVKEKVSKDMSRLFWTKTGPQSGLILVEGLNLRVMPNCLMPSNYFLIRMYKQVKNLAVTEFGDYILYTDQDGLSLTDIIPPNENASTVIKGTIKIREKCVGITSCGLNGYITSRGTKILQICEYNGERAQLDEETNEGGNNLICVIPETLEAQIFQSLKSNLPEIMKSKSENEPKPKVIDLEGGNNEEDDDEDQDSASKNTQNLILVSNSTGHIEIWQIQPWKKLKHFSTNPHSKSDNPHPRVHHELLALRFVKHEEQTLLATASKDGTISLWNPLDNFSHVKSFTVVSPDDAREHAANLMIRIPEELTNIGISMGQRIEILNLNTQKKFTHETKEEDHKVEISDDGKYLAVGGRDLHVFNTQNGKESLKILRPHKRDISAMKFFEDNNLVTGTIDGGVKIWSLQQKTMVSEFTQTSSWITNLTVSDDSEYLISGTREGSVHIWQLEHNQPVCEIPKIHENMISSIEVLKDNLAIISSSLDGSLKFTPLQRKSLKHEASETGNIVSISISEDNVSQKITYAYSTKQGVIKIFEYDPTYETREEIRSINLSASAHKVAQIKGKYIKPKEASHFQIRGIWLSKDGGYLISGSEDGYVRLFKLGGPEVRASQNNENQDDQPLLVRHNAQVRSVAISENNKWIISASDAFDIKITSLINDESGNEKLISYHDFNKAHKDQITTLEIEKTTSPDLIFSGSKDFSIKVHSITRKELVFSFENAHKSSIRGIALSRKLPLLVSGSEDHSLRLWNYRTQQLIYTFDEAHEGAITTCDISENGMYIVSGGYDGEIKVWSTTSKQLLGTFQENLPGVVQGIQLTPSCLYLASASTDHKFKLWALEEDISRDMKAESLSRKTLTKQEKSRLDAITLIAGENCSPYLMVEPKLFEKSTINTYFADIVIQPYNWNILFIAAIRNPNIISHFPDPKELKLRSLVDSFDKTPLHYILAHKKMQASINMIFKYIINFLEDEERCPSYERARLMKSLSPLSTYIIGQINQTTNVQKFMDFCIDEPNVRHGFKLHHYGDTINKQFTSPCIFGDQPILTEEKLPLIYKEGGSAKIRYKAVMTEFNYDLRSDDSINLLLMLTDESRTFIFEDQYIQTVLNYLWEQSMPYQRLNFLNYSILMIIISFNVAIQGDVGWLDILQICMAGIMLGYEVVQLRQNGWKNYFSDVWNILDDLFIGVILAVGVVKLSGIEGNVQSWLESVMLFSGYLRWISYLRILDSMRHLIRTMLKIFADMRSFMIVLVLTITSFSLMLSAFQYNDNESYIVNLYTAYFLLFVQQLQGDTSSSLQGLNILFSLVLDVVFLNMLINIMGQSFGAVASQRVYADNKEKVSMVLEIASMQRALKGPSANDKGDRPIKKHLLFCQYSDEEMVSENIVLADLNKDIKEMRKSINELCVKVDKIDQKVDQLDDDAENKKEAPVTVNKNYDHQDTFGEGLSPDLALISRLDRIERGLSTLSQRNEQS